MRLVSQQSSGTPPNPMQAGSSSMRQKSHQSQSSSSTSSPCKQQPSIEQRHFGLLRSRRNQTTQHPAGFGDECHIDDLVALLTQKVLPQLPKTKEKPTL